MDGWDRIIWGERKTEGSLRAGRGGGRRRDRGNRGPG